MACPKVSLVCEHVHVSWQVKLSSKTGQNVDIVWTENGLLITATGEQVIRSVYTYCLYTHTVHSHFKLEYLFHFLGCGTWSEMTTMFWLSTRLWGLREERWSTVFHTVQEKVAAKYFSHSSNLVKLDLVVSRYFISSHSQTLSRLITHNQSTWLPQCYYCCACLFQTS